MNKMENVKKVKAGELAIKNDDREALIKCIRHIWDENRDISGDCDFYQSYNGPDYKWSGYDFSDQKTMLPTILATELLKEIKAWEQPKQMTTLEKVTAYLEKLDEPYRTEALSQIDHKRLETYMPEDINSISVAVGVFADWSNTIQGGEYWINLWQNLTNAPVPSTPNPKDTESLISELTAKKEAIEAEIEKLKAEKENSKKFNADRALAGEPCETMGGEKVLAIHRNPVNEEYPLYLLLEGGGVETFTVDGFYCLNKGQSNYNLKMS